MYRFVYSVPGPDKCVDDIGAKISKKSSAIVSYTAQDIHAHHAVDPPSPHCLCALNCPHPYTRCLYVCAFFLQTNAVPSLCLIS